MYIGATRIRARTNPAQRPPHFLDLGLNPLFFVFASSSDSGSSLVLFVAVLVPEDTFVAAPATPDGGLEDFAFGLVSSSSSEANGSSSAFFFLSWSLGLALGFEVDSSVVGSSLLSSALVSASSFLDFVASRSEKNLSLRCCWGCQKSPQEWGGRRAPVP